MDISKLLKEETKGARLQIPLSLVEDINNYQSAYRLKNGRVISRETVIIKMMVIGRNKIKKEATKLKKEAIDELLKSE